MRLTKAFTLVELMVSVVVLSIVTSLASLSYVRQKRSSSYRAAVMNVLLIARTEKRLFNTDGVYVVAPNTAAVNQGLGLSLVDSDDFFNYRTLLSGSALQILFNSRTGSVFTFSIDSIRLSCVGGSDCWVS